MRPFLSIFFVIALVVVALPEPRASAQDQCFPETSHCIGGPFSDFWTASGGLRVFGFPISPAANEINRDSGTRHRTQWFERNRFELHNENQPPYNVLLGRLGDDRLRQLGRDWQVEPREQPAPGCLWFEQTGHNVCNQSGDIGFRRYWESNGLQDLRLNAYERSLALFGLPLTAPRMETNSSGDEVLTQWFERARFEWHPNNPDTFKVLLGLLGNEVRADGAVPVLLPRPRAPKPSGLWVSAEEIAGLPMSGDAWDTMKAAADGDLGPPNIADYNADHDVNTLAVALVYARTGDAQYREKAAQAIRAAMGTEEGGLLIMLARNVVSYVIAADLIGLRSYDPALDEQFRRWIDASRTKEFADGTLIDNHEKRANNHGTMAGAARAVIAVYLDDEKELIRVAQIFRGWLGDRAVYHDFGFGDDLSWQADPSQPVPINPPGAVKDGLALGGAMPAEMRRGCEFKIPPCRTPYPWGGLAGAVVQAMVLDRQGYDAWAWQDNAILRAVEFLFVLEQQFGGWWADSDDTYLPWVINFAYDKDFPASKAGRGKNMGWTDWMYGR